MVAVPQATHSKDGGHAPIPTAKMVFMPQARHCAYLLPAVSQQHQTLIASPFCGLTVMGKDPERTLLVLVEGQDSRLPFLVIRPSMSSFPKPLPHVPEPGPFDPDFKLLEVPLTIYLPVLSSFPTRPWPD